MLITSKSLFHSNIVVVFEVGKFLAPENSALAALYQGEAAKGARFIDDPILRTKVLELPQLKLQIAVEPSRLRVEDLSQEEPQQSFLIKEFLNINQQLFSQFSPVGFGFNFDIHYRFSDVIRLQDLFDGLANREILEKADLKDLGVQFTLDKEGGKKQEQYFIKITAPLEIAVHVNHHFPVKKLPDQDVLQKVFEECYEKTDVVIQNLKF